MCLFLLRPSAGYVHILISTAYVEIIRKVSKTNTPRMCSYNAMPRNNPNNSAEPYSLEFK